MQERSDECGNGDGGGGGGDGEIRVDDANCDGVSCGRNNDNDDVVDELKRPFFLAHKLKLRSIGTLLNVYNFQLEDHLRTVSDIYLSRCKCRHTHNKRPCPFVTQAYCSACDVSHAKYIDFRSLLFHRDLYKFKLATCCIHTHAPPCNLCLGCRTNRCAPPIEEHGNGGVKSNFVDGSVDGENTERGVSSSAVAKCLVQRAFECVYTTEAVCYKNHDEHRNGDEYVSEHTTTTSSVTTVSAAKPSFTKPLKHFELLSEHLYNLQDPLFYFCYSHRHTHVVPKKFKLPDPNCKEDDDGRNVAREGVNAAKTTTTTTKTVSATLSKSFSKTLANAVCYVQTTKCCDDAIHVSDFNSTFFHTMITLKEPKAVRRVKKTVSPKSKKRIKKNNSGLNKRRRVVRRVVEDDDDNDEENKLSSNSNKTNDVNPLISIDEEREDKVDDDYDDDDDDDDFSHGDYCGDDRRTSRDFDIGEKGEIFVEVKKKKKEIDDDYRVDEEEEKEYEEEEEEYERECGEDEEEDDEEYGEDDRYDEEKKVDDEEEEEEEEEIVRESERYDDKVAALSVFSIGRRKKIRLSGHDRLPKLNATTFGSGQQQTPQPSVASCTPPHLQTVEYVIFDPSLWREQSKNHYISFLRAIVAAPDLVKDRYKRFSDSKFSVSQIKKYKSGKLSVIRTNITGFETRGIYQTSTISCVLPYSRVLLPRKLYELLKDDYDLTYVAVKRDPSIKPTCLYVCLAEVNPDPDVDTTVIPDAIAKPMNQDQDGDKNGIYVLPKRVAGYERFKSYVHAVAKMELASAYKTKRTLDGSPRLSFSENNLLLMHRNSRELKRVSKFFRDTYHGGDLKYILSDRSEIEEDEKEEDNIGCYKYMLEAGCGYLSDEFDSFCQTLVDLNRRFDEKNPQQGLVTAYDLAILTDVIPSIVRSGAKGHQESLELFINNLRTNRTLLENKNDMIDQLNRYISSSQELSRTGRAHFSLHCAAHDLVVNGGLVFVNKLLVADYRTFGSAITFSFKKASLDAFINDLILDSDCL